jgi:hypothetical protein
VEIARYLSTDAISGDPKNHCVPIYDIIPIPGMPGDYLIVMPLLRAFDKPDFENIGQFLEFMHQILEVGSSFDGFPDKQPLTVANRRASYLCIVVEYHTGKSPVMAFRRPLWIVLAWLMIFSLM